MVNLCNLCRKPQIIKNKYVSSLIGTICIYLSISFILPVGNFSVYITSYINIKQEWVTMHYGTYFSLILTFSMTFSRSFGGLLENKMGFMLTTQFGLAIVLVANIFFFNVQNIFLFQCSKYLDLLYFNMYYGYRMWNSNIFISKKFGIL